MGAEAIGARNGASAHTPQPTVRELALMSLSEHDREELLATGRVDHASRACSGPMRPRVDTRGPGLDVHQHTPASWASEVAWHTYWQALTAEHGTHMVRSPAHERYEEFAAAAPPPPLHMTRVERVTWRQLRARVRARAAAALPAGSGGMNFQPHAHAPDPVEDLCACPRCRCRLVYPVDWWEASASHWNVELRCPNCEWTKIGVYDQATVDRFDLQLDLGTTALVHNLRQLEHEHMSQEADRFAAALAADAILPEDF